MARAERMTRVSTTPRTGASHLGVPEPGAGTGVAEGTSGCVGLVPLEEFV